MSNIIDYVKTEMASFSEKPFNAVDSLVLSQFSYTRFDNIVPGIKDHKQSVTLSSLLRAECFEDMYRNVRDSDSNLSLLFALAASPRFRNIKLSSYIDEKDHALEKQFSAVTFLLSSKKAYIAFRGTDATLVGWKEDFNMAFKSPVPSQLEAVDYVQRVAKLRHTELMLGGHSKGGNLAVYASAECSPSVQKRIERVYSHDGPGFKADTFKSEGFIKISNRIQKTLPQSAIIGMLLENQENYSIVKSNRMGPMQHDPFSWIVENGRFVFLEQLTRSAKYMDRTLNEWLSFASDEQRQTFVDTLYEVISAGKSENFAQIRSDWQKDLPLILERSKNIDPEAKTLVIKMLKAMASSAFKNLTKNKNAELNAPKDNS